MREPYIINQQILSDLGLSHIRNILELDLELRIDKGPVVTMTVMLRDLPPVDGEMQTKKLRFVLDDLQGEQQPEPIDIGAMCDEASKRLEAALDADVEWHKSEHKALYGRFFEFGINEWDERRAVLEKLEKLTINSFIFHPIGSANLYYGKNRLLQ